MRSSAGEHYLDMVGVTGSIPVAPTILRSRSERRMPRRSPTGGGGLVAASFGSAGHASQRRSRGFCFNLSNSAMSSAQAGIPETAVFEPRGRGSLQASSLPGAQLRTGAGTHTPRRMLLKGFVVQSLRNRHLRWLWVPAFAGTTLSVRHCRRVIRPHSRDIVLSELGRRYGRRSDGSR